jgi:hypothetical protein
VLHERFVIDPEVVGALQAWVQHHPEPDRAVRLPMGGRPMSPRMILHEVEKGSKAGREFVAGLNDLAAARPNIGMRGLLSMLREPNKRSQGVLDGGLVRHSER